MKVALVHDYLNQYGGGERVLEVLMEMFPDAPVYTLLYDEEKTLNRFSGRVKKTSFLDFPFAKNHHRLFIPLMPFAAASIKIPDEYDLIISDTAGYAKGVNLRPCEGLRLTRRPTHISYIHTPLRYAWEVDTYFSNPIFKTLFRPVFWYLRWWDYRAGQKPDLLIANSQFIADKIKKYYGRQANVIYPPVDTEKFSLLSRVIVPEYYLAVGRLLHYKRFDLIIDAFAKLGLQLKIVGDGPEKENLKTKTQNLKADNIEFVPFVPNENDLRKLYNDAKALIFPQVEDFGLVAAEAQACGTPVIAYRAGGATEIIKDGETGVFFDNQTSDSIINAVKIFENFNFDRKKISQYARVFSKENFKKQFLDFISRIRL